MAVKAPFNYIGNKYRIINSIQECFPEEIDTFVDLFCGGCDVSINTQANSIYANDINYHVIDIMKAFQQYDVDYLLEYIDTTSGVLTRQTKKAIRLFVIIITKAKTHWTCIYLCVSALIISFDLTAITIITTRSAKTEAALMTL